MGKSSLRGDYLRWLESQLRDESTRPSKSYWDLVNVMFERQFEWSVPHDDNRLADGLDLRAEYAHDFGVSRDDMMALGPCSFLEVLLGLSRKLAFTAGGKAPGWAWTLLENLGLSRMSDPFTRAKHNRTQEIMDTAIYRRYSPDGQGGFFPLAYSDDDQTTIELWYQMNAFVEELHPEF